jgi:hypothetical protein
MAEHEYSEFHELCIEAITLTINVGLLDSVSNRWPDEVQEAWIERMQQIRMRLSREIEEVQEFASSYD